MFACGVQACRTLGERPLLIDTEKATSSGVVAVHSFVCQVAPESKLPAGLKEELI